MVSQRQDYNENLAVGIPKVYWLGIEGDYNAMAMDLLGPNLDDLFKFCDKKFTLETSLSIADRIVIFC